jgi:type I restriction enzyme S subunit
MNNVSPDGAFDWSEIRRVPADGRKAEKYALAPGDVVFNSTNSPDLVGKTALFSGFKEPIVFSNHFLRIRVDSEAADPGYVARWLSFQWKCRKFENLCTRWVNQASVRKGDLLDLQMSLPELSEQRRIAGRLEQANRLCRTRRYALELTDTLLPAAFLGPFGDPKQNPNEWPEQTLSAVCSKLSDGPFGSNLKSSDYRSSGVRVVRLQNIGVGEFLDDDKVFVSTEHFAALQKHECIPGDVLIGTMGDPNLRACIQPPHIPIALNKADCIQALPDPKQLNALYLQVLLNIPSTLHLVPGMVHGQTRARVSMGELGRLPIPVPPLPLQQKFATLVERVERLRAVQREALRQAEHLFSSLLDCAFSADRDNISTTQVAIPAGAPQ